MLHHLSDAEEKGGIFTGPQIRVMLASQDLEQTISVVERNAWGAFTMVVTYFLGKNKCENYAEIAEYLIQHYEVLVCRMSIKLYYLHSHLEFFRQNVNEEHGECFHQDIEAIEKRYQGRWGAAMMCDYIWGLVHSDKASSHKRNSTLAVHF
jgi:hypothetical protein